MIMLSLPQDLYLEYLSEQEEEDVNPRDLSPTYFEYLGLIKMRLALQDAFPLMFPKPPLQNYKHHIFLSRSMYKQALLWAKK